MKFDVRVNISGSKLWSMNMISAKMMDKSGNFNSQRILITGNVTQDSELIYTF
jgi:hypothetical protein